MSGPMAGFGPMAFSPFPYGPVPSSGVPSLLYVDLFNDQTVAGVKTWEVAAVASTAETIATFKISDDPVANLTITNNSSTDARFLPTIQGIGNSANVALTLIGASTSDSGTNATVVIDGRRSTPAALVTRPVFQINNFDTTLASVSAKGAWAYSVQSTASTAETLATWSLSDNATSLITFENASSSDTSFVPRLRGVNSSSSQGLMLMGQGTTDTGTTAVTQFLSRIGANTDVATRPLFSFLNRNTEVAQFNAGGSFVQSNGRVEKLRVALTTPITVATDTDYVVVSNMTTPSAVAVTLPASPAAGRVYIIKDGKGDSAANNITVTPAAGTIDGAATSVVNTNYGSRTYVYNGTEWNNI